MTSLTKKEKEALIILFKDFTSFYSANSISKIMSISHVGAQKIFKRLYSSNILKFERIGKSIIYKLRLEDDYVCKLISFLLADEANKHKRWMEEFNELYKEGRTIVIFGSVLKNYEKANDIDIMIIENKKDEKIRKIIDEKDKILSKKIHLIQITYPNLMGNIKKKNKTIIDIIKNSIILYGQERYVNLMKNVTSI